MKFWPRAGVQSMFYRDFLTILAMVKQDEGHKNGFFSLLTLHNALKYIEAGRGMAGLEGGLVALNLCGMYIVSVPQETY